MKKFILVVKGDSTENEIRARELFGKFLKNGDRAIVANSRYFQEIVTIDTSADKRARKMNRNV